MKIGDIFKLHDEFKGEIVGHSSASYFSVKVLEWSSHPSYIGFKIPISIESLQNIKSISGHNHKLTSIFK